MLIRFIVTICLLFQQDIARPVPPEIVKKAPYIYYPIPVIAPSAWFIFPNQIWIKIPN
jgi:hypothetical protein